MRLRGLSMQSSSMQVAKMIEQGVLNTVRGSVSIANGYVSLTDIWLAAGRDKFGNHPVNWCDEHGFDWFGDDVEQFATTTVALAYAWHLSPSMGGSLEAQLERGDCPFQSCESHYLKQTSEQSRSMFVEALKSAGINRTEDFAKLCDLLYMHTLDASARTLRNAYGYTERFSIRNGLDAKSLAKVVTAEINVASAIYLDQPSGYAEVAHKIRQHGQLVATLYRTQTH